MKLSRWARRLRRPRRPPLDLDPDVDGLIEESRARAARRLRGRELLPSLVIGLSFLAVAVPLAWLLPSDRSPPALTVALLVLAYAAVSRVEFEVGAGSAVPTQLVLVPMLFILPLGLVPIAVATGFVLGNLADHFRGGRRIERSFALLGSSWHAVGPALVLVLAGEPAPGWAAVPVLLAALAAQFVFDFVSATAHDWLAVGVKPRSALRFIGWVWVVDAALAPVGLLAAGAQSNFRDGFLLALPLVGLLAVFARERRARIDHALELSRAYRGTAFLLGDVIEADDAYTGSHSRDVVSLVLEVAEVLGLSARERRDAEFAALLHDVGKIRIPAEIINKPGRLTPDERAVIETHTVEGERMLERVGGLLGEIGRIVRSCHERHDGRGYPDGLAAEEIPRVARIVACCDAFNAMTTDRPYRRALSHEAAIEELRRNAGTQFDPAAIGALLRVLGATGELSRQDAFAA